MNHIQGRFYHIQEKNMQKMDVKTIKWYWPCVCGRTTVVVCCGAAIALVSGLVWGTAVGVKAWAGGRSYFCNCNRYASAVGTLPQHTSNVLVLALTNWTRDGAGGFSVNNNNMLVLAQTSWTRNGAGGFSVNNNIVLMLALSN